MELSGSFIIRLGVIKTTLPAGSLVTPDTFGTDNVLAARCLRSEPGSGLVVNSEASIYSSAVTNPEAIARGRLVRQDISTLVATHFMAG